jgi:hypothetical protein
MKDEIMLGDLGIASKSSVAESMQLKDVSPHIKKRMLSNQLPKVQLALFRFRVFLLRKRVPEPQRLVAGSSDNSFASRAHGEIKHTVGMPRQRRDRRHRRVFPNAYLVLRARRGEAVR